MARPDRPSAGLGIVTGSASPVRQPTLNVAADDSARSFVDRPDEDETANPVQRLYTTPSTGTFSGTTRNEQAFSDLERGQTPSLYSPKEYFSWLHSPSQKSLLPKRQNAGPYDHIDEHASLRGHLCNSSKDFKQSMFQWPGSGILLLSIVSTSLSCLFFLVAAIGPRYRESVGTHGMLSASTAAFLTSLLAKIIEVSYVTLVVAYIGQTLARKAYSSKPTDAVSFAEISMRHWAVQPGWVFDQSMFNHTKNLVDLYRTMFSHWRAVRHAAISRLGAVTLVATISALLYTTAATALVQPQLRFSGAETRALQGKNGRRPESEG